MSSPPRTVSAKKISNKTYAAAASPTRPMVPAVARLSLENTPPPVVTTEPFPPLPKASTETSPLAVRNSRIIIKSASAEELARGRITRQPAIIPSQEPEEPTQVPEEKIPDAPLGAPASNSTQRLLIEDTPDKEVYFGSFEQDSFDLEDCFNGSTQPENSSLLQKRVAERQRTTEELPKPKTSDHVALAEMGPPSQAESEARTMESISANVRASTPLKYQSYKLGIICSPAPTEEAGKITKSSPVEAVVTKKVKQTLIELRQVLKDGEMSHKQAIGLVIDATVETVDGVLAEIRRQRDLLENSATSRLDVNKAVQEQLLLDTNRRFDNVMNVIRDLQKKVNQFSPANIREQIRAFVSVDPLIPRADQFEQDLKDLEKSLRENEKRLENASSWAEFENQFSDQIIAHAIDTRFPGLKRTLETLKSDVSELKRRNLKNPFDPRNPFTVPAPMNPSDSTPSRKAGVRKQRTSSMSDDSLMTSPPAASGSTTRKRVYVRDANDDVAHRAKRSCDDLPQFRPATPESIPPILHENCQDCGTVPREEPISRDQPNRRVVPCNDVVIGEDRFLDAMCPLDRSEEFHSIFAQLPVIVPCQVACPTALGNQARNPSLLLPHLIQLHNHISATMRLLQNAGPHHARNPDEFKTFQQAAGIPFLQAFQVSVRRAYVAGMCEDTILPQHAINRAYDSISIPELAIVESNSFKRKPAAEAYLTSQPTIIRGWPSLARPGKTLEISSVLPLVKNYSGGARPPPTPAVDAHTHSATCSHTECVSFRQAVKRGNYNATNSLATARIADPLLD